MPLSLERPLVSVVMASHTFVWPTHDYEYKQMGITLIQVVLALAGVGAGIALVGRYFGLRSFGTIYGATCSAFMAGSALGPFLLGLGFDLSGSYSSALMWCTGGMVLTTLLLLSLPRFPAWGAAGAADDNEPASMPAAVVAGLAG